MPVRSLNLARLVRRYWKLLALGFVAMLVEAAADLLEPWPLKIIFDYVLGSKRDARWLVRLVAGDGERISPCSTPPPCAVIAIAVVGAVGTYTQKYLSTTVGQAGRIRPAAHALPPRAAAVAVVLRAAADRRHGRPADQRHRRRRGFHLVRRARHGARSS